VGTLLLPQHAKLTASPSSFHRRTFTATFLTYLPPQPSNDECDTDLLDCSPVL